MIMAAINNITPNHTYLDINNGYNNITDIIFLIYNSHH